jgi:hypothetical protein
MKRRKTTRDVFREVLVAAAILTVTGQRTSAQVSLDGDAKLYALYVGGK